MKKLLNKPPGGFINGLYHARNLPEVGVLSLCNYSATPWGAKKPLHAKRNIDITFVS
jgi:hypothetical protein